jgi:ABC-type antimicrobial peptide transport system permease subunit
MKTNVPLISTLRKPFSSILLLILLGLISFGFITKAIGFILVQRETGVLGSYYRSIGILENNKDPQSGDISAGIDLIETSPYFAYGDQREIVSGVMQTIYNSYGRYLWSNCIACMEAFPKEHWPNVHMTDRWFVGELITKEEVKDDKRKDPEDKITIGYYLKFNLDTVLAAYPEHARQGSSIGVLFMFEGNEAAIPIIEEMEVGQRYFARSWKEVGFPYDFSWENAHESDLLLIPLNDQGLWYLPLTKGASVDFNTPAMSAIKNEIDVLNENLHTLGIIATADMSAMPEMQESSRDHYLVEGRWLNHQDDLEGNKVIVVPSEIVEMRDFKLGDEISLTFRPLIDTYFGLIRDGIDSASWRSYPTYQDSFKIVGIYKTTHGFSPLFFIPASSLRPGFASSTQNQFKYLLDYSFVLDTPRNQTSFIQEYKTPLQELGINLTFLPNNGPAYWAAVDPIRRSASADILVFGLLMVAALVMAVFIYLMQRRRDYAILRALGVTANQANRQIILPLLLLGGVGIVIGGLPSWNYALTQAKGVISTIPTPAGVTPSAHLSPVFLAGLCLAVFLLLVLFSWLGVFLLARKPVLEILQDQTYHAKAAQARRRAGGLTKPIPPFVSSLAGKADADSRLLQGPPVSKANLATQRKYHPSSLSWYVIHHVLRSRLKSFLTLVVAFGFVLTSAWIRQTMERSRIEVDRLYDTTVLQADIILADSLKSSSEELNTKGNGFVYQKTIDSVLNSGFVISSTLEADITWPEIGNFETITETMVGRFPVYAYDSPEAFYSNLTDPGSLRFATGWDMKRFARPRTMEEIQQEGVPALFPASMLERLHLGVGEKVRIIDPYTNIFPTIIVGQYSGGRSLSVRGGKIPWTHSPSESILISLSSLESILGSHIKYTVAHFVLDPAKNRELAQFRLGMEKVMQASGAGTGDLRFMIWDEELRVVVSQLDKNMSLLQVLYPVVMTVSVLIGAGLCFLLLLQATKEAAILRVLGTTRPAVRLTLIVEPLILSMIGVIIGLGIAWLGWRVSGLVKASPLLLSAVLYLAGVMFGLVLGSISVTNKKPIELLQVKE